MPDQIERFTEEDLAGSGASREHAPALLERLNLLVDRANAGGESGLVFETIAALRAQSTEGFASGRSAIVKSAQVGGEGPMIATEFFFVANLDVSRFATTDEQRAAAEATLAVVPDTIWQTTRIGAWLGLLPAVYNASAPGIGKYDEAICTAPLEISGVEQVDVVLAPFTVDLAALPSEVFLNVFVGARNASVGFDDVEVQFFVYWQSGSGAELVRHYVSPAFNFGGGHVLKGAYTTVRLTPADLTPPTGRVCAWGVTTRKLDLAVEPKRIVLGLSLSAQSRPSWDK